MSVDDGAATYGESASPAKNEADAPAADRHADQGALLGAALAATVSISVAETDWEPIETVIGIVLMIIVLAYWDPSANQRSPRPGARRAAFAAVLALCTCLAVAYPLSRSGADTVTWLPIVWLSVTAVILAWPRMRSAQRWLRSGRTVVRDNWAVLKQSRAQAARSDGGLSRRHTAE